MLARIFVIGAVAATALTRRRVVYAHSLPTPSDLGARFERLNKNDVSRELIDLRKEVAAWPAVREHVRYINACTDRDFLFELSYEAAIYKAPLRPEQRVNARKILIHMYEDADDEKKKVIMSIIAYYKLDATEA